MKITGQVNPNGDQDYYSFAATAGDRVYAATQTAFSASASTDSILELFNTDGTTLIEGDEDDGSFGSLSSSLANATIPTTGTYFIRVRHNSATVQLRPYFLYFQLQSGSPTAETEPNDIFPGQAMPASGWVSGDTSAAADVDFYSLSLNAGDTVYLSLDLDPERNGDWNGQLGLGTFDTLILVVNDSGAGFAPFTAPDSEAFFMTVKDAGTYGVFVGVPTGQTPGTYTLSATVFPAVTRGINCTTYTSTNVIAIPDTGVVGSALTVPGNPRIEHLQVSIQLNHTFMTDLDVELISPTGNVVGLFNDVFNATTGGRSIMDLTLDDYAAIPPAFQVSAGMIHQPELNYRLDWFKGQPAGGTWTLRIRDDVAVDTGTLTGWSIRICEPAPVSCGAGFTQTTVFSSDFESGAAGFTHSGTADEWELGLPATVATTTANPVAGLGTCNSGANCWKTDLDNTYNTSSNQDLLSPNINLAGLSGPIRLNWAQWFQMDTATNDHAWVEVRQVGLPATAVRVWQWDGATMTLAVGTPVSNIGEAAGWGQYSADISSFAGQNIEVVFHLDSGTGTTNFAGLAIDDVSVTACMAASCMITSCPANITQPNDPNQCGAVVNYPSPTSTGICGTFNCSPGSGSFFPVGTTTVTCTATGAPMPSCMFTVTVQDTQPPAPPTCPGNVTQPNDPNQCGAVVNYTPPLPPADNCSATTVSCSPSSGSFFPVGTTTVTCTASDASPDSPNSMCSFTVTVTNAAPVLSYSSPQQVIAGQVGTINPATGPTDSNLSTITVLSVVPGGGTVSVNNATGVVTVGNTMPVGSHTVTIRATDQCGVMTDASFVLNVVCPALTLAPSLANGVQSTAYNQSVVVGPTNGYTFAVTTNILPPGLSLNAATGAITGTPTAPGNYAFGITATLAGFACTKTQSYNLLITGTCATITVNPATLPNGTLGTAYPAASVSATGGAPPHTFAVTQGVLPAGLALNGTTGDITGTPTAAGSFSFRVTATAAGGCVGSRQYVVSVACSALTFSPAGPALPNGAKGVGYNQAITVTPGTGHTFSLQLGSLPPGYTLSAAGVISGITNQSGAWTFTIKAVLGSCQATKQYTLTIPNTLAPTALAQLNDYDGDGRADFALWSNNGVWRLGLSNGGAHRQAQTLSWGQAGDVTLSGDYDGDGKTDLAVFRPSNGTWYVKRSGDGSFLVKAWGVATDVPVPGDYDGDGQTDMAVFRPSDGNWYVLRSSDGQYEVTAWGAGYAPYNDVAVPGDYDGDGRTDLAVFRRSSGTWLVKRSSDGQFFVKQWGLGTDVPVAADYDGDGRTDCAVWRGTSWYIWQSATNSAQTAEWGTREAPYFDQAVPSDYDGDGQADITVWRAGEQTWYVRCSLDGQVLTQAHGQAGDRAVHGN